jgi:hypothetical protein
MEFAINKLKEDEIVLMKKIKSLKDGKPKWSASKQLDELRMAIKLLERYDSIIETEVEHEDEILQEIFINNPPKAMA